jgi:hypothetical protein
VAAAQGSRWPLSVALVALTRVVWAAPPDAEPEKIKDNLFLLEEAYNQDPGVVQHIQSFSLDPKNRQWLYTFTDEWPVPTDLHQLSVMVPLTNPGEGGNAGIGDVLLNYRIQAIGRGGVGHVAMAPRLSLVVPTGSYRNITGRGGAGIQACLPVSFELGESFATHLNIGLTFTPRARAPGGYTTSAFDASGGVALVWLALPWLNPLVEVVALSTEEIDDDQTTTRQPSVVVNPGLRGAINFESGLQIVPGVSMPVERSSDGTGVSVLFYLSFEHPMWTPKPTEGP